MTTLDYLLRAMDLRDSAEDFGGFALATFAVEEATGLPVWQAGDTGEDRRALGLVVWAASRDGGDEARAAALHTAASLEMSERAARGWEP